MKCPIHGEFWQSAFAHLKGAGCPICSESKIEKEINQFLIEHKIQIEREKHFKWLGRQSLDFYLSDYNVAIECQGIQHFEPIDFTGRGDEWAKKEFIKNQERDQRKLKLCQENGVKILYFTKKELEKYKNDYISELIYDKQELLNEILKK